MEVMEFGPYPGITKRRCSFPSIPVFISKRTEVPFAYWFSRRLRSAPVAAALVLVTFVVTGGRSIYGTEGAAAAGAATTSAAGGPAPSSSRARQRRMYNIESPRRTDMGSVPDVSHVPEVGDHVTSSQR